MSTKANIAVSYCEQREDGWHFKATFGPFETKEEADRLASWIAFLEVPQEETAPPALGVSVSETVTTKDKFG